jgi:hypothetical protein
MSRVVIAVAVAMMIAFAPDSGAQVKAAGAMTAEAETVLTLVSVDPISHIAVLRGADGLSLMLDVPPDAQRMERAKPGALFRMRLAESLGLQVEKGGTAGTFEDQTVALAPPGAAPALEVVNTTRVVLAVQAVDTAAGRITLRDADNRVTTFVYSGLLADAEEIAVGDTFSLVRIEALTLEMLPDQLQTSR